jgi:hypothetical protein
MIPNKKMNCRLSFLNSALGKARCIHFFGSACYKQVFNFAISQASPECFPKVWGVSVWF